MIRPADGFTRPEHTLKMLVLPAPFGPTRPVIMPALTARVTLSTASAPPYLMVRFSTERLVEPAGRGDRVAGARAGRAVSAGAAAGRGGWRRAAALARRGGWVLIQSASSWMARGGVTCIRSLNTGTSTAPTAETARMISVTFPPVR